MESDRSPPIPAIRHLLGRLAAVMQVPVVVACCVLFAIHWDNQMDHALDRMRTATMDIATVLRERFGDVERRLDELTNDIPAEETPAALSAFHEKARAAAKAAGVDVIVLVRPDGQQVINTRVPFGHPLPRNPETMMKAVRTGRPAVNDLAPSPVVRTYAAGFGVPVLRNGRIEYGLNAGIEAQRFTALLQSVKLPEGWGASIADSQRVVVAEVGPGTHEVGERHPYMAESRQVPGNHGPYQVRIGDEEAQVLYRISAISGWSSHVAIPHSVLYAPIRLAAAQLALALVAVFAASIWVATRFAGRISRSVEALGHAAREAPSPNPVALPLPTFAEAREVAYALEDSGRAAVESRAALMRSEQRLQTILQTASSGVIVCDGQHRVVVFNAAAEEMFGRFSDEVVGGSASALFGPRTWRRYLDLCVRLRAGEHHSRKPVHWAGARSHGTLFPADVMISVFTDLDGERYCTLIVRDVTVRLRAQLELARAQREVRRVSDGFQHALLKETDAQLAAIAGELHDAVGSSLAGISMLAGGAAGLARGQPRLAELLEKLQDQVRLTAQTVRHISRGIMPAGTEAGALLPALERFAADISGGSGIRCTVRQRGGFERVPPGVGGHLYRIVQEATANAVRHGGARRVRIALAHAGNHYRLTVRDDGSGADLARLPPGKLGVGMRSIHARAVAIGGTAEYAGAPGHGCRVRVAWTAPSP
ncbi:MAG: PAS domain S-box protein [Burkholderiales bacterium]|nr:PAS domain S-box protein [Burkholderiales bacterium]